MITRRRDEAGESLVEIVLALVILGLIVGAFFTAMTTSSTASKAQRDFVTADAVLRDYAETAKQAVRTTCINNPPPNTAFTVTLVPAAPPGFNVTGTIGPTPATLPLTCPAANSVSEVDITATLPGGLQKKLAIDVRTP